jgi:hypothetical protein
VTARPLAVARMLLWTASVAAAAAILGCGGAEPLDMRIEAASAAGLAAWEDGARGRMGPRLTADFDGAVAEIRLRMLAGGLPPAVADGNVAAQLDGASVRQVLLRGFGIRLKRLEYERSQLKASLGSPGVRGPMAGDHADAPYLSELHSRQRARLKALALELDAVRRRLDSAAPPANPWAGGPADSSQPQAPVPLPRAAQKG